MKLTFLKNEFVKCFLISLLTYLIFFGKFLLPNYYFWGSDSTFFYFPSRSYFYERIYQDHSFPFWTEKQYLGFPIYADAENGYLNPINILSILIFGPDLSYKILHLLFYLIGSLSFYYFLKRKGIGFLGFTVANLIYFFSNYLINHQIHFNIILTFYLFPAGILLIDKFIENSKIRYVFLISIIISFSALYGHFQSAFIFCLGIAVYYLVFNSKKIFSFQTLILGTSLIFLILIQTLPQLLPSYEIYQESSREESINMYKGSLIPVMTSFTFIPYAFGDYENYIGIKIKKDFSYTEMYIYAGISVFLIYLFTLLFTKPDKLFLYSYITFWIFLIFATSKYNYIFGPETPIISMFRYWIRVFILFLFGMTVMIAKYVEKPEILDFQNFKKRIWFVLIPIIYVVLLQTFLIKDIQVSNNVFNQIISKNFLDSLNFKVFLGIFIVTLLILGLNYSQNKLLFKNIRLIKFLLILIVLIDIYFFSLDVTKFRLQEISSYVVDGIKHENSNSRSVYLGYEIVGQEYLNLKSWSMYGYSQFLEQDFEKYLTGKGIFDLRAGKFTSDSQKDFTELGISKVFKRNDDGSEIEYDIKFKGSDLIKNEVPQEFITRKSGNIVFKYNSPSELEIKTRLKYSKNWEVKINNEVVNYKSNDIFLKFKAPAGENIVEINYIPKSFYLGVKISGILFILYLSILILLKKFKYLK